MWTRWNDARLRRRVMRLWRVLAVVVREIHPGPPPRSAPLPELCAAVDRARQALAPYARPDVAVWAANAVRAQRLRGERAAALVDACRIAAALDAWRMGSPVAGAASSTAVPISGKAAAHNARVFRLLSRDPVVADIRYRARLALLDSLEPDADQDEASTGAHRR